MPFFFSFVSLRIKMFNFLFLALFLPRLFFLIRLIGIVCRGNINDFFHCEGVVFDIFMRVLGVEGEFLEDAVEELGVDFVGQSGLLGPFGEIFLELWADVLEKLIEDVIRGQLIERFLGIVSAI